MLKQVIHFYEKRATLFVALFFLSTVAFAAPVATSETYKDIIEKAQNLSIQKDRLQAMGILVGALKKEKKAQALKELSTNLETVAKIFYSDKAQQTYELALSLATSDLTMSVNKMNEAIRLEPDNISIELALIRSQLAQNDCDGASNRINKYKEMLPYIEDLRLHQMQALLCAGKLEDYVNARGLSDYKKSSDSFRWQILEIEYFFRTNLTNKAREAAQNSIKLDEKFPESYYWLWKAENDLKVKSDKSAQKYLSLCKTMSNRHARQFFWEPLLCRRTTEVETYLKKNNNSEL